MSDGRELPRYLAGQRIALGIELHDDSGIYDVKGLFVHSENPKVHITLPGYGGGAQRATVYLQNVITTNTLPGQYVCEYIQAQDGRGNYNILRPDLSFYVEPQAALIDNQGPELTGWHFPLKEIHVVEMSVIQAEKGDVQQYANRQPAEITSGMSEDTGEQEDTQGGLPEDTQGGLPEDTQVDTHQLVENKINERISEMTEDTESGGDIDLHIQRRIGGMTEDTESGDDIGLHIQRRMDEVAQDVTEETGAEGDVHLHVQRRMDEMAKKMFEDD